MSSRTYLREIQPLFSLEYECLESGERATVSSADGWTVAAVDAGKDARQFILSGCAKLPDVIVTLTVRGGDTRIVYGAEPFLGQRRRDADGLRLAEPLFR